MVFGFIHPINKFLAAAPNTVFLQELKSAVATIKPGNLVARVTDDTKGTLATIGTNVPIGVAGYEQSFLGSTSYTSARPATLLTAYASDVHVPIISGTNFAGCLKLTPGFVVTKGDRLASFSDGNVVPYISMMGGFAIKVPFEKSITEVDTGIELPQYTIVTDAFTEVVTNASSGTLEAGILSTEASGDLNGFIDIADCATAGLIMPVLSGTAVTNLTVGELLSTDMTGSTGSTAADPATWALKTAYVCDGTTKTIAYKTSDHTITGNIVLVIQAKGMIDVGAAEETLSVSASVQDVMARVSI